MTDKKILITGAAGFVGMELCIQAKGRGYGVYGLDAFRGGLYSREIKEKRAEILLSHWDVRVHEVDLLSSELQIPDDISAVVHAAAMPGLDYSWRNPSRYIQDNEIATLNLIKALTHKHIEKFVLISTSSVYGKHADGSEDSTLQPISPYGLTKLAAERLVNLFMPSISSFSIARLFSVYGPGQRPDMGYFKFINAALNDSPITIFGDGTHSRSNTYIDDAVDGILGVLERGKNAEAYNIGGGEEVQLLDAINTIYALAEKTPNLIFGDSRPGDQLRTSADIRKANSDFGYQPKTNFVEGITNQFNWQRKPGIIR